MANLLPEQLLMKVKAAMGVTGDYQDETIQVYIDEVKAFLLSAGVHATVLRSDKAVGIIARGVMDLWNYGAGDGKLSPYFYQRVTQLAFEPSVAGMKEADG
jgi:predicted metal-dependent peptidase